MTTVEPLSAKASDAEARNAAVAAGSHARRCHRNCTEFDSLIAGADRRRISYAELAALSSPSANCCNILDYDLATSSHSSQPIASNSSWHCSPARAPACRCAA
jgi:hypothetical protein